MDPNQETHSLIQPETVFGVSDPVVLVTGSGADRVGQAIALAYFRLGYRVVIHANSSLEAASKLAAHLNTQRPDSALVVTGKVEDEPTIENWLRAVRDKFGRIDVLVNSAAIWEPIPLEESTAQDLLREFSVNALGAAITCKYFGLWMTKQEFGGAIINIGDWATTRPYQGFSAYFASKGAVETITKSMAVELASRNPRVRVNAVLPGPVKLDETIDASKRAQIINECLLKREGSAEDVALAAVFLSHSPFITGVLLPVDGGRSIYAGPSKDPVAHPLV